MGEPVSYRVVKEPYGWAVRLPDGAMMPFRARRAALAQAVALADLRRALGEGAQVAVDESWPTDSPAWRRAARRPMLSWLRPRPLAVC